MSKLSALQHLGLAFESVFGTKVVPTFFVPVNSVKPEDDIKKIYDEGRRANLSKLFQVYDGVTSSKVDISMNAHADAVGYFLKAILGAATVTGTTPNFTHTFKVVNAMPLSTTLSFFNGVAERAYAGSMITDLSFKFDNEGILSMDAKYIGQKSAVVTTTTPTYSAIAPFLGYQTTLTIGGSANTNVVGGEINIKRDAKLLYTSNNSATASKASSGRIEVSGKFTFDVEDESELNMLGSADAPIVLTFTQNTNLMLTFTFTLADIKKASIDSSQEFVRCDVEFDAIYNATDGGMCQIVLKNAIATY